MKMKNRLILWFLLLAVGFAVGFIPQFRIRLRLESQVEELKASEESMQHVGQIIGLRDSISLAYLEVTRLNYGNAAEYAARFFDLAQELAAGSGGPALKPALDEILNTRDAVTAALAKGDATSVEQLRSLLILTFRSTGALKQQS